MSLTTEDMVYRHAATKHQKRKQEEEPRQLRHKDESTLMAAAVVLSSDDSSGDDTPSEASTSYELHRQSSSTVPKCPLMSESSQPLPKHCIIDDPHFNAALDRTKTSTRQAMMIVSPALAVAVVDVSQLSLSRTSLMEARKASREALAANYEVEAT